MTRWRRAGSYANCRRDSTTESTNSAATCRGERPNNACAQRSFGWLLVRSAVARLEILSTTQRMGALVAAIFYIVAGAMHFINSGVYQRIMPPYIPSHLFMVRVSGALEILGGLGLLVSETRRAAAWGLVALLIAVFPANIYMATHPIEAGAASIAPVLRWGRLPLQLLLVWWLLWSTRPRLILH